MFNKARFEFRRWLIEKLLYKETRTKYGKHIKCTGVSFDGKIKEFYYYVKINVKPIIIDYFLLESFRGWELFAVNGKNTNEPPTTLYFRFGDKIKRYDSEGSYYKSKETRMGELR